MSESIRIVRDESNAPLPASYELLELISGIYVVYCNSMLANKLRVIMSDGVDGRTFGLFTTDKQSPPILQVYFPKIPRSIYARESQSIRYYLRQISVYTCISIMHPPNPEHRK